MLNVRCEMTDCFVSTQKIKKKGFRGFRCKNKQKKIKEQQEEEKFNMGRKNEPLDIN